jgi:hypothetical protein
MIGSSDGNLGFLHPGSFLHPSLASPPPSPSAKSLSPPYKAVPAPSTAERNFPPPMQPIPPQREAPIVRPPISAPIAQGTLLKSLFYWWKWNIHIDNDRDSSLVMLLEQPLLQYLLQICLKHHLSANQLIMEVCLLMLIRGMKATVTT